MKIVLSIACAITLLFCGCSTEKILTPAHAAIPASTNEAGVYIPAVPATPAVVTNIPNETVTSVVSYGNAAVPFVPAPWNGVLAGVLALATLGSSTIASIKNRQLNNANAVTATVVAGVESAGELAKAVKAAIATRALRDGTADAVHAAVNEHAN
jgi:hypothetical protein